MRRGINFLQMRGGNAGVNLCRRQTAVPQQFLHHAQIGTAFEQMRRERVAQGMRRHVLTQPDFLRVLLHQHGDGVGRKPRAAPVNPYRLGRLWPELFGTLQKRRAPIFDVTLERLVCWPTKQYQT